ncbi:MAG: leucine-rich repeat domain-containing protein, partial [Oscillospiraceae bacterium]|nr:leucine-rich repeat domain-containing protein [Oscillospiraceae bacterium]
MRKHMKLLAAFLTAVIMLSSISMLVSAVEVIDFGQVDIVNTRCSYTWEYLDNDVLKIKPTDRDIYLDKCFFTDYMQTAFTSDTQIIIDLSNLTNATSLNLYGSGCPSGELVFTGNNVENIKIIEFINFNDLHSVSLKNGFSIIVDIVSCGVTSVDIFRGGEISTLYVADCNNLEEVVIPDNINNFQISTCRNVVSLDIPDSLKGLSANTLPKLESFDIPETLKSCSLFQVNFTDVFVPNTLEYFTISHALDLESATVEEGSTRLFSSMFTECYGLQNVNIPYGVTTIEYNAFNGCTSLSTVELPDSVNKIYSNAFRRSGIRYIDLPRGITAIEYGTFAQCTNLQAITIPHSVTKIDDSAFVDCYSLDDIYFDGSRSQWESITVYNHLADSVSEMSLEDLFPNVNMHFNTFIYKGPEDFTGPVGSNAEFSVVADGDPNDFTYQWMYFKNGVWADFDVESATTPNLTFPITEDLDGIFVHCAVKDNEGMTLVSTEAKLTVKGKTAKIVGYPSSATNCIVGDIEIFMVSAEGDGLKYQWQVLKPGAEAWVNCSINDGAKTATLEIEVKESRNGCQYKCVVTDKYGNTVETDPVSLTIGTSLEIIEQPECYEGYLGEYAIFNVVAQGEGLKYQWQVEKDGWVNCSVKDGAKTDTLTLLIKESRDG